MAPTGTCAERLGGRDVADGSTTGSAYPDAKKARARPSGPLPQLCHSCGFLLRHRHKRNWRQQSAERRAQALTRRSKRRPAGRRGQRPRAEFRREVIELGMPPNLSAEIDGLFHELDVNRSGALDLKEAKIHAS